MNLLKSASFNGSARQIRLHINDMEPGKQSYPAFLNETVAGKAIPGHRIYLFLNKGNDNSQFFGLSGPIRKLDESGNYIMIPRQNAEGQFLSEKGQVVTDASKAGLTYEYVKGGDGEVLYGSYGTLSVTNLKADKTPTKQTFLTLRLNTDLNVLEAERARYRIEHSTTDAQRDGFKAQLADIRKAGDYINLSIKSGGEFLSKLGFEVRLTNTEPANQP